MTTMMRVDGQAEALRLLRRLQKLNWSRERPSGSARLVHHTLRSLNDYPESERLRFSRVISEWLVTEVLGCGWNLEEYEANLAERAVQKARIGQAHADPQFKLFLDKINFGQTPPIA